MKKALSVIMKIAIPAVVTVGLCYVLLTGIDLNEMMEVIKRQCDFRWIAAGMALSVVAQVIRARRWQLQLRALHIEAPLFAVVLSIFGTYAVNLVFPRLGEIWRTGYIAKRQDAPFATVFGSMVADRVADIILVALVAAVTFLLAAPALVAFVERYPQLYNTLGTVFTSPLTWAVVVALTLLGIWLYMRYGETKLIAKARQVVAELWQGFAVVFTMPRKMLWIILSLALWGCYFLQFYVAMYAFPFTVELLEANGPVCALVAFTLSSMAMGIPSNGGIGPWQVAVIFALTLYAPAGLSTAAQHTLRLNLTAFANMVMGMETLLLIALGLFTFLCIMLRRSNSD